MSDEKKSAAVERLIFIRGLRAKSWALAQQSMRDVRNFDDIIESYVGQMQKNLTEDEAVVSNPS